MFSRTKSNVGDQAIREMVKDHFGSSYGVKQVTELTDGWFNSAYSIQFDNDHPDVVLRVAPPPDMRLLTYEKNLMRSEVKVYELIRRETDVPLPGLYGYNFKGNIIDNDYMFIGKCRGRPLDKARPDIDEGGRQALEYELGAYAARVHALTGPKFGYLTDDERLSGPNWPEVFLGMISALLDDGRDLGANLPKPYPEIKDIFREKSAALDEVRTPSLVHWDLWDPNIFVIERDGRYVIEAITDWERAFWGDPLAETVFPVKPADGPFFQGYGRALSRDRSAVVRMLMYGLYLYLVMVIEARVRFEEAEHLEWAYDQLEKGLVKLAES